MQIELKVSAHPSGRLTLTERTQMDMMPHDCGGPLFANDDAGAFYKAVAAKLHMLHKAGHDVTYEDKS